jgi:hypothetical protein
MVHTILVLFAGNDMVAKPSSMFGPIHDPPKA